MNAKNEREDVLITLDQVSQTIEVLTGVVERLRRQVAAMERASGAASAISVKVYNERGKGRDTAERGDGEEVVH